MKKGINASQKTMVVDWEAVYRRLDATRVAVEGGWTLTREEQNRIFKERARAIAQEVPDRAVSGEHMEVVEFLLAHERYAVASASVREVYPLTDITPLPCTPAFLLGVINVRGRIISVIDIKRLFELPDKGLTDLNKVLIIQGHGLEFGILADAVLAVHALARKDIQPSVAALTGIRESYLVGVTRDRLVILDADKLLLDREIRVEESVE